MTQREQAERWIKGEDLDPRSIWFSGNRAYSYGLPIAVRVELHGRYEIRMVPGPWSSVTTQRHRNLLHRMCVELDVVCVSAPTDLENDDE